MVQVSRFTVATIKQQTAKENVNFAVRFHIKTKLELVISTLSSLFDADLHYIRTVWTWKEAELG